MPLPRFDEYITESMLLMDILKQKYYEKFTNL